MERNGNESSEAMKNRGSSAANTIFHDRALFALLGIFIPAAYLVLYFGNHNRGLLAVCAVFAVVLSYLGLSGYVLTVSVIRLIRLRILRSPFLFVCIMLLALMPFGGPMAVLLIDQIRFHKAESHYLSLVQSDSLSHFKVFDWGSSGFVGSNNFYYLVFDDLEGTSSGPVVSSSRAYALLPDSSCSGSASRLSGHFFSVTIVC